MKNDAKLWQAVVMMFGLSLAMSGCRSYLTIEECEEQLAEFPPKCVATSNAAKGTIAPLGADVIVGLWQGEYVHEHSTYDGRMAQASGLDPLAGEVKVKLEFLPDGTFMLTREGINFCSRAYSAKYGENVGKSISKFAGRWDYVNGKLTLSMNGKGSFDTWTVFGEPFHRDITSLREILPTDIYIVDWFSDKEILLKSETPSRAYSVYDNYLSYNAKGMSKEVLYDEFGRECEISRVIMESKNGKDYGLISVTITGSKILRKIK